MPLYAPANSVHEELVDMGTTSFSTKAVFGNASSLMVATRPEGYHSRPHQHDSEQINWLQSGDLWVFIEEEAVHLRAGDFLRIPANAIHWSWNLSDNPCTVVEVHTPGLQDDPIIESFAVGLYGTDEVPNYLGSPVNIFLDGDSTFDASVAEADALAHHQSN